MKKRILFVLSKLAIGGIEKSAIAFLRQLPADRYDIDLGVVNKEGGFLSEVPANVRVFEIDSLHRHQWQVIRNGSTTDILRHNTPWSLLTMAWLYAKSKRKGTLLPLYSHYINRNTDSLPEYDIAISFQGPSEILDYYVSHVVRAKRKFSWIHFDINHFYTNPNTIRASYTAFERIFVVSKQSKTTFDERFPEFADRTEVMYNIIEHERNLALGNEYTPFTRDGLTKHLVTVGRVVMQKAQDECIRAARILKDAGLKFVWHFVGDGVKRAEFEALAKELDVADCIDFAGNLPNPYPYLDNSDIYVQPSRYEGFCIAIGEAKLFGMPIVATDFQGAIEQLTGLENAVIIHSHAPEAIAKGIRQAWDMPRIEIPAGQRPQQIDRLVEIFG